MATAEDIGAHVFDEGHWYHETLEEGLAISYRVRARAARSIVVVTAAASERRTTDALSESSSPSIDPPPLAVAVLARFAPASTPPREPNLARRSSAPERSLALSLSRARVLVAVAPLALTHPPSLITPPPTSAASIAQVDEVLHRGQSAFQTVEVVKTKPFGRLLITDGLMQSSEDDEYVYHQCLVHPALAAHPAPKKVFIAGGGEVRPSRVCFLAFSGVSSLSRSSIVTNANARVCDVIVTVRILLTRRARRFARS